MNFLPEDKRNADVNAFLAMRLASALKIMETQLDETATGWPAKRSPSPTSPAAGYLFYPEDFAFDRADYPNIDRWLDQIAAQPGWKHPYDMMPRALADADLNRRTL